MCLLLALDLCVHNLTDRFEHLVLAGKGLVDIDQTRIRSVRYEWATPSRAGRNGSLLAPTIWRYTTKRDLTGWPGADRSRSRR
jgi:hypothetical protein